MDEPDEAALVAGLKAGRPDAFRTAVTRYSPRLLATARAIVGPAHAEDIVQEAWLTVFNRIGEFEQRAALGTWLSRIVSNRAISHLRRHAREVPAADGAPEDGWFDAVGHWNLPLKGWDADSPDDLLAAADLAECIEKHLALMPANQRQVVVMRDIQELDLEAIRNDLDLSASNVRVLLHRGRMRLMAMIAHFQTTGSC